MNDEADETNQQASLSSSREIYGYIYKIYHPEILRKTEEGKVIEPCYIGKTKKLVAERFRAHKRDAQKVKGNDAGGDGKLHAVMWGEGVNKFKCVEIDQAYDVKELSEKEKTHQEKCQSIRYGWNKIEAPLIIKESKASISVFIAGKAKSYDSIAHMCQNHGLSYSTVTYWIKKKGYSIQKAYEQAVEAKNETLKKKNEPVIIFRRPYKTLNEAVRDKKLNKHLLNEKTVRARLKKGMLIEDCFTTPQKKKNNEITIKTPDGQVHVFSTIAEAHRQICLKYKVKVALTTVVSYIKNRNLTPEQAFGFVARPWEKVYSESDTLIIDKGYKFIGKKDGQSKPIILHLKKEIYSSVKRFAKEWGLEYTTAAEELKKGLSAEQVLLKRNHPGIK